MTTTQVLDGAAASPGIGVGPRYVLATTNPVIPALDDPVDALAAAQATSSAQLAAMADSAEQRGLDEAAEILRAQALMAEDPMFADEVAGRLGSGDEMEAALEGARETIAQALRDSGSEYLAQRADDVGEVVRRIAFALAGETLAGLGEMVEPAVVVARSLTAADTAAMDPGLVLGFATEEGGPTGHVAVIARALGIPAAVAVPGAVAAATGAIDVIVDGSAGRLVVNPDDATRREYADKAAELQRLAEAASKYRGQAVTVADRVMTIAANVGSSDEVEAAIEEQADGIGLFRTEFLFLDKSTPPTEDEQVAVYRSALDGFDYPVVIRTFDIGGDKPAQYVTVEDEENPFLGVRGMRLYEPELPLAKTQARALLRAATSGDLWVMAPMVATVDDARWMRDLYSDAANELEEEGLDHGSVKLGVMIEVPAAALNAAVLARHVDFFSIGTNDLTQYTLAADRTSAALAQYADAADPAVLRLCAMTAEAARAAGVSVSVCGEAAADPGLATLFAAMGMDKLSMNPPAVNLVKKTLAEADLRQAEALLDQCLRAESASEVRGLLAAAMAG